MPHSWEREVPEATDVVDRQIAAFRDRDLDRFLAFYAADVKVRDFDGNVLMEGWRGCAGSTGSSTMWSS